MIAPELIKLMKENGIYLNVYTVNEFKRAKELFKMGVGSIISDSLKNHDF